MYTYQFFNITVSSICNTSIFHLDFVIRKKQSVAYVSKFNDLREVMCLANKRYSKYLKNKHTAIKRFIAEMKKVYGDV